MENSEWRRDPPVAAPLVCRGSAVTNRFRVIGLALLAASAVFAAGCATTHETEFHVLVPRQWPLPLKVAVLPAKVATPLAPENLVPENAWYQQLADGRGVVVSSKTTPGDIPVMLVSTLSMANQYESIFPVASVEEAARLGADEVMLCIVRDYRTVLRGANARYPWLMLLGTLAPQYWIRWLTIEARLDWEIQMWSLKTGQQTRQMRLQRSYFMTVRYALGSHFTDKMLVFLRFQASPELIAELFQIQTRPRPGPEPELEIDPRALEPAAAGE